MAEKDVGCSVARFLARVVGRQQGCRLVQEVAKGNRLAVVKEGDDGFPGLDDPAGQNLLGLGQVHGRPVPDVVAAPCLPAEEDVFPDRQDNEICLSSYLDGLLNHLLVVLQGGEINLVDVAPVGIGISGVVMGDLAAFRKEELGGITHEAFNPFVE